MKALVLTSVMVVARHYEAIGGLEHVEKSISEYIDYSHHWTMARAAAMGHIELLRRLHANGETTNTSSCYVTLNKAMEIEAQSGYLEIVQFLHVSYPQRWQDMVSRSCSFK
ncbi:unnamed protein product [Peronospora belbahrii]|uniref:Uncharacterized protein n=1 Tax=Peronospora belbahrii TaxID=622444 RepID=A0ABN8D2H4_9STRA|nr:unnamed protein product [Peronospora belbahrii]